MARFPRREADIAAMAGTMVFGLAENAEDFPDCPVSVERLQEALARYNRAKDAAAAAGETQCSCYRPGRLEHWMSSVKARGGGISTGRHPPMEALCRHTAF